ncbi:DUF6248 family natural product biosynthesis protein [Streptomyces caniscabiei]|uniref:DUF6248 family natural product biosynthesis protein n=1 Tax=Streptomyces caniscabiei TaxID=2746961 RepID=UPI0007661494|nr:DUF6248 family natural product biosynthesis protein [Streptomyces caniscabiei]
MTPAQAEWVRTHVWPAELARFNYRNEHLCSCTWPCPCQKGRHNDCAPSLDVRVASIWGSIQTAYDLGGPLLHRQRRADVVHLPQQRPCRQLCQCAHPHHAGQTAAPAAEQQVAPRPDRTARRTRTVPVTAGQIGLFEEAAS